MLYDENDFSDKDISYLYPRSKIRAELEAWSLAKKHNLNVSTILPCFTIGECFGTLRPPAKLV